MERGLKMIGSHTIKLRLTLNDFATCRQDPDQNAVRKAEHFEKCQLLTS